MDDLDGIEEFLNNQKKADIERHGLKSQLQQILWDAQVDDEYFNEVFCGVINLMRTLDDSDLKEQLGNIDLSEYPLEDE